MKYSLASLLFIGLVACGQDAPPKPPPVAGGGATQPDAEPTDPGAKPYAPDAATQGDLTGKAIFKGTPPKRRSQNVECDTGEHIDVMSETVIVNDDGTLRNVFVYVKKGLKGYTFAPSSNPVALNQQDCRYEPHVFGLMVGQPLKIKNSDGTLHNIHSLANENKAFNLGQTPGAENTEVMDKQEIMFKIKCDVHGWMSCYAGVVKHPFFAVTGDDGTFSLKGLPAGEYTVTAWHEEYGKQDLSVTVKARETATLDFTFEKK